MSGRRRSNQPVLPNQSALNETLATLASLGNQVSAKAATELVHAVSQQPDWTKAQIEAEVERSIGRMEIAARDAITALGGDPDGDYWRAIWTEMQRSYRERVAELMGGLGSRAGRTLQ